MLKTYVFLLNLHKMKTNQSIRFKLIIKKEHVLYQEILDDVTRGGRDTSEALRERRCHPVPLRKTGPGFMGETAGAAPPAGGAWTGVFAGAMARSQPRAPDPRGAWDLVTDPQAPSAQGP